jgi:vesicle coat complex subunit
MVYLFLKEVAESTDATEVIIVVQSLCKDMNNSVDIYRSNSIRTLAKIIDVSAASCVTTQSCVSGCVCVCVSVCVWCC